MRSALSLGSRNLRPESAECGGRLGSGPSLGVPQGQAESGGILPPGIGLAATCWAASLSLLPSPFLCLSLSQTLSPFPSHSLHSPLTLRHTLFPSQSPHSSCSIETTLLNELSLSLSLSLLASLPPALPHLYVLDGIVVCDFELRIALLLLGSSQPFLDPRRLADALKVR